MPNHVRNVWGVQAPSKKVMDTFLRVIAPELQDYNDHILSFESINPTPDALIAKESPNRTSTEEEKKELIAKYGSDNWYDWRVKNWGTKWDAYDQSVTHHTDTYIQFQFDTAWSFPAGIVEKLRRQFPKITFDMRWADEDTGNNVGHLVVQGLSIVSGGYLENGSKEAYELAFELCGGEEYYQFNEETGMYEYHDEEEKYGRKV